MDDTISQAKAELLRSKGRIEKLLELTPDERINWSPSPTARTPIQLVAHSAMAIIGLKGLFTGTPFPFKDTADMESSLREMEKHYASRKQALEPLDQNTNDYVAWLDTLTPEQLSASVTFPFGFSLPLAQAIGMPAQHMQGHASQLDYIQTIYGDREWHMG